MDDNVRIVRIEYFGSEMEVPPVNLMRCSRFCGVIEGCMNRIKVLNREELRILLSQNLAGVSTGGDWRRLFE